MVSSRVTRSQTGASPRGRGYETPEFRREGARSRSTPVAETGREEMTLQHMLRPENELGQDGERAHPLDAERSEVRRERRLAQGDNETAAGVADTERVPDTLHLMQEGGRASGQEQYDSPVMGIVPESHVRVPRAQRNDTEEVRHVAGNMSDLLNQFQLALNMIQSQQAAADSGAVGAGPSVPRVDRGYSDPYDRRDGYRDERREVYREREREYAGAHVAPMMSTGRDFGLTATLGNTKFTVAMPAKFNPETSVWLLWKPQVLDYFEMIGLPEVLNPVDGHRYTMQENRFVIGALQSIIPDKDSQWISTLQLRFAYQAWAQLEKAYGSKPELDMQRKLVEFDYAKQGDTETTREWTVRLERMVTELNVMSKEAARENLLGYSAQRDTAVFENTHKFRLLNVRVDGTAHEAFLANLRTQVYQMSVQDVEKQLVSYEQGQAVQQALSAAAGRPVWETHTRERNGAAYGRAGRAGRRPPAECYACGGVGHVWTGCESRNTRAGRERLLSNGIRYEGDPAGGRGGRGGRDGRGFRGGRGGRDGRGGRGGRVPQGENPNA
jgi:hypothetical protein